MEDSRGKFRVVDIAHTIWNPKVPLLKLDAVPTGEATASAPAVGIIQLVITDPGVMKDLLENIKIGQIFVVDPILVDEPADAAPKTAVA